MFRKLITSPVFRRRTSWIVAAVLILPLIVFFHISSRAPVKGPGGTAGTIFGHQVPWETFEEQRLWLQGRLQHQLGMLPELMDQLLTQYTWDRLLLLDEARRRHLRVTDARLADFIRRLPALQEQGRFQPERYKLFLRSIGMRPETFERLVRSDLTIEDLATSVKESVAVSDDEVKAAYMKQRERLTATVFLFSPEAFTVKVAAALTDADLRASYEAHPDEVRIPDQLMIEVAGATREALAARVQPTDEALDAFYQDHRDEFAKARPGVDERRAGEDGTSRPLDEIRGDVRQRLIDERVRKQLTTLALDLEDDTGAGATFEEIAAARALARKTAGPIPVGRAWVPGGPEPAVLRAVAGLAEGTVSEVIRTDTGVYLARVTQRIPSRVPPFEEVRAQVRQRLIEERAREAARADANVLHARLTQQTTAGLRFEEAALAYGALPAHPAAFNRSEPIDPIGHVPPVNEAAFATPLGHFSQVLETPAGFVIIRPETRIPADGSTFVEAKEALRQETLAEKQSARLEQWLQDLRRRAKIHSFVDASASTS